MLSVRRTVISSALHTVTVDYSCNMASSVDREPFKSFNDPVHGFIELSRPLLAFIDTPQFQRLRYIKQLGLTCFVYFGAVNTRFEHCIGTCYLAGLLVRRLNELQPKLGITKQDILCVELAGLCHDIGHGPFSHAFEMFMKKARPDRHWNHEDTSMEVIDSLINENPRVREELNNAGLDEKDIVFIKELIIGKQTPACGRDKEKAFLFDIISNKGNGIDVDKFDYFARDCHHSGLRYGFDHLRVIKNTKVLFTSDGVSHICFRDKIVNDLGDMFQFRYLLHRRCYQHRTTRLLEHMMMEVLLLADKYLRFEGKDNKSLAISECVDDMTAYCKLRDSITDLIRWSSDSRLQPAKAILEAIERRELYKRVGEVEIDKLEDENDLQQYLVATCELEDNDIVVIPIKFTFGSGLRNPLENVLFYEKDSSIPQQLSTSKGTILTRFNAEKYSYQKTNVFLKKRDDPELLKTVLKNFNEWCSQKSTRGKANDLDFTPHRPNQVEPNHSPPETVKRPKVGENSAKNCRRNIKI